MNNLDYIIIAVLAVMVLTSYFRGFIKTLFNLVSMVITFGLTYYLYPYVSKFIMTETGLYKSLSEYINVSFDFENLLEGAVSKESQFDVIGTLPFPEVIKDILATNNNTEMFDLLDVSSFTDYVSSSLASIAVNIIVFIVLFLIIWLVLSVLVNVLDLVAKLPGLKAVNRLAGAGLGLLLGLAYIFIGFAVLSLVISMNQSMDLVTLIDGSIIGSFLYNQNPVMDLLNNNIENNYFWNIIAK